MITEWIMARIFGNFGVVQRKKVYRSGQSWSVFLLWPFLGLSNVVNLSHKPDKDFADQFEEWVCNKCGIGYFHLPTLTKSDFDVAFRYIETCAKPVIIHCEAGKDRTGALVAVYEREILRRSYLGVCSSWRVHFTPGHDWLAFLFKRWEG